MVAVGTRRAEDGGLAMFLSIICPGLGQLHQGRFAAAAHYLVETGMLIVLMVAVPSLQFAAALGLLGVGVWSVLDARRGG